MHEALVYFFQPAELSLYQPVTILYGNSHTVEHRHVRVLRNAEDMRSLPLKIVKHRNLKVKNTSWRLGLTVPKGRNIVDGFHCVGEVIFVTPEFLGNVAVDQHDYAPDSLMRPLFFEARHYRFLMREIQEALDALKQEPDTRTILERLRMRLSGGVPFFRRNLQPRNMAEYMHLVHANNPDYLRARDERARQMGRPSLSALLEDRRDPGLLRKVFEAPEKAGLWLAKKLEWLKDAQAFGRDGAPQNTSWR